MSHFVIMVQLRHKDDTAKDFFMALALNVRGPRSKPQRTWRYTREKLLRPKFDHRSDPGRRTLLGRDAQSSGLLDLGMTLEPIPARPSMLNIKPTKMKEQAKKTLSTPQSD
jgi:hypothetical protein